MSASRDYDSTIARIAGNIAAGLVSRRPGDRDSLNDITIDAVKMARAIVAETKRTEPEKAESR